MIENFEKDLKIPIIHAWGMTEMSPVGTVCRIKPALMGQEEETLFQIKAKQGLTSPLVEMRVLDDEGKDQPHDGKSIGELVVRGPWVIKEYYKNNSPAAKEAFTSDGYFRTGDIVTIDPFGYMEITDRKKDLIKTRGEWLSSVEMENYLMAHEDILEACVVGKADELRGEAVIAFLVPAEGKKEGFSKHAIIRYLGEKFARWQVPREGDLHIIDSIPKTSVGKFDKKVLRAGRM